MDASFLCATRTTNLCYVFTSLKAKRRFRYLILNYIFWWRINKKILKENVFMPLRLQALPSFIYCNDVINAKSTLFLSDKNHTFRSDMTVQNDEDLQSIIFNLLGPIAKKSRPRHIFKWYFIQMCKISI